MFERMMMNAGLKILQAALCQFFNFCMSQSDCPDGVCNEVVAKLQNFDTEVKEAPTVSVTPMVAADVRKLDWSRLQKITEIVGLLIVELRLFFGIDTNRVG